MKKLIITMMAIAFSLSAWSADYKICMGKDTPYLENCVNNLLRQGYEPFGSLQIVNDSRDRKFRYQAMYRR